MMIPDWRRIARRCALALVATLAGCASRTPEFVPPTPEAAAYRTALLEIREADQAPRVRLVELLERYDHSPPDSLYRPLALEVQRADSVNLERLEALVARFGWPKQSEVGEWAATGAFLVIQHSPLEVQLRYEPALRAAVEAGEANPAGLGMLTDRIRVRQGRPQLYGSQTRTDPETGARSFHPIEDEANLDARRAAIGMEPMAEYARRMGVEYTPPTEP